MKDTLRAPRASIVGLLAFGGLLLPGLSACVAPPADGPCMPPPFVLSPAAATPGTEITVSGPAATCNPRYGDDAQISIDVYDASDRLLLSDTAPMSDAGVFDYSFTLPPGTAAGEGSVVAMPHDVDWCDDTGTNHRLNSPAGFVRVSCAAPVQILKVLPQ